MSIWERLGIEPTLDKRAVKKAYHACLKHIHPEDDPEAFMGLREAYEAALASVESGCGNQEEPYYGVQYGSKNDWMDQEEGEHDHVEIQQDETLMRLYEKRQRLQDWWRKVVALYGDYDKRMDAKGWKALLYEDIPYQIEFYEMCRTQIYDFLISSPSIYLPKDVRQVIDGFFSYSATPLEMARNERTEQLRMLNKKMKLCETIQFDKLIPDEDCTKLVDRFCEIYEDLLDILPAYQQGKAALEDSFQEGILQELKDMPIAYLPFECIYTALHFQEYTAKQMEERIGQLRSRWENGAEIKLLQAQYHIYKGDMERAAEQLGKLYREVPAKNYGLIYQMAECCRRASMYYEAYMLVKQLTWLNPKPFMYDMAEELYERMESTYTGKKDRGEELSDLEHIHMCRMYLRSNKEEEAIKVLREVKDTKKHLWEYEIAHCLCIFYEEAKKEACNLYVYYEGKEPGPVMDIEPAKAVLEALENDPKDWMNSIEKLEWEELWGRYLFEQRRYNECVNKCNELLEEYPLSYPVLLLRGYADYGKHCMGPQHAMKDYGDFNFLISVLPERIEARLAAANAMMFGSEYSRAAEVIEPVKEKLPDHYEYYSFLKYKDMQPEKYKEGVVRFFQKAEECELGIPPVSKYRLLDIHNIFAEACEFVGKKVEGEEEKRLFSMLEGMKNSNYNHPKKYMDLYWLYYRSGRDEEALQTARQELEDARTKHERKRAYCHLTDAYWSMGKLEEAEKFMMLRPAEERINLYASFGNKYQKAGNPEKAIRYIEEAKSVCAVGAREYAALGRAYYETGEKDKAVEAVWDGIRIWGNGGDYYYNGNLYYDLYLLYIKQGKWDMAIEALEKMRENSQSEYYSVKNYYSQLGYVYWRRSTDDGTGEENKVIKLWSKAIEKDFASRDIYGRLAKMYNSMGQTDKAEQLIWKGIKACGAKGDYFSDSNLYRDLYNICQEAGMWEKAVQVVKLMKEHTDIDLIKADYPCYMAYASIHNEDYETAYENFLKVKENPEYPDYGLNMDVNILLCCYGLGNYEKACSMALNLAYSPGEDDDAFFSLALRCRFMSEGMADRKLAGKIEKEIQTLVQSEGKEGKSYYAALVEVYMALGEEEKAEYYRKQALSNLDEQDEGDLESINIMEAWRFAYRREFDKALEYYEKIPPHAKTGSSTIIEYRYFQKMAGADNM